MVDEDDEAFGPGGVMGAASNMFYKPGERDEFMDTDAWQDVQDSDDDDFQAKVSDAFLLVGNTEEDVSMLEVHVYDEVEGSLFGALLFSFFFVFASS